MKILVIMKRFGANKDMVMQDFGRQIRLFEPLAKKHKIDFFCPDYTKKESKVISRKGIKYIIRPVSLFSLISFYSSLNKLIKKENYDVIIAATDPLIGILGYHFSKKHKIPLVYDLQDNFEVYGSYKLPFVSCLDKKAVKNADVVLTVSESLKKYISKFREKPIHAIQNGIDLKLFRKIDKKTARRRLKLPKKGKIIVYIGEISRVKGLDLLIGAFKELRKSIPDSYLLLSGQVRDNINVNHGHVIYRKCPGRNDVIAALNASDVAVIPNRKCLFSEYCFPYKLLEYMAVNIPIVATGIGDTAGILRQFKGSLCRPGSADDMKKKIIMQLKKKGENYEKIVKDFSWENLSHKIDRMLSLL